MKLRKRKSDRTVSLDEPQDTGEDRLPEKSRFGKTTRKRSIRVKNCETILNKAVDSLKPSFRTVFVLRDIEELSQRKPLRRLGISIPAVKSRLLRARLQLREKLTRYFKRKGDDVFAYM